MTDQRSWFQEIQLDKEENEGKQEVRCHAVRITIILEPGKREENPGDYLEKCTHQTEDAKDLHPSHVDGLGKVCEINQ